MELLREGVTDKFSSSYNFFVTNLTEEIVKM